MGSDDEGIDGVKLLTSTSYRTWKIELDIYLESKGLLGIVNGSETVPENPPKELDDWYNLTEEQQVEWAIARRIPDILTIAQDGTRVINTTNLAKLENRYEKEQLRTEKKIESMKEKKTEFDRRSAKARQIVYRSISKNLRPAIASISNSKELVDKLTKDLNKKNNTTNILLKEKLRKPWEWGSTNSWDEYLAYWTDIVGQLEENKALPSDADLIQQLYQNLPRAELAIYLENLEEKLDEKNYTYQEFLSKVRADVTKKILAAERNGGPLAFRVAAPKQTTNNSASTTTSNNAQQGNNKQRTIPTCHHCSRRGHIERKCWVKHPELRPANDGKDTNKTDKESTVNTSSTTGGTETVESLRKRIRELEEQKAAAKRRKTENDQKDQKGKMPTTVGDSLVSRMTLHSITYDPEFDPSDYDYSTSENDVVIEQEEPKKEIAMYPGPASYRKSLYEWNQDSACSRHMAANQSVFNEIIPLPYNKRCWITVGNGAQIEAKGMGSVTLTLQKKPGFFSKTGNLHQAEYTRYTFENVLYVPQLMANLISTTQLADMGVTTVLLGRRKNDTNVLRGAAIDVNTKETLFTMSSTAQGIYSLDVIPNSLIGAKPSELQHDDNTHHQEKYTLEAEQATERMFLEAKAKELEHEISQLNTNDNNKSVDVIEDDWPSVSSWPSYDTDDEPVSKQKTPPQEEQKLRNPYDSADALDSMCDDSASVASSEFEQFEQAPESAFTTKTSPEVINPTHEKICPHDHDLETTTFERLWHHRLGHPHSSVMKTIGYTADFKDHHKLQKPTIHKQAGCCAGCMYGKARRKNRHGRTPARRTDRAFEMVHFDTVGLISPMARRRKYRYFQIFVEDMSRYVTLAYSAERLEGLTNLQIYNSVVNAQYGYKVRRIRSDRGTELLNSAGSKYFDTNGILHEKSAAYTQRQNGVSERQVQTIVNKTRTLIYVAGAPLDFWHYASAYATWVHNRLPNSSNQRRKSPYEILFQRSPDLSVARVWGCDAYSVHHTRKKLEPTAKKYAFVGIEEDSPNYILYDPRTKQTTVSTDVVFDEVNFSVMEELSGRKAIGININQGITHSVPSRGASGFTCSLLPVAQHVVGFVPTLKKVLQSSLCLFCQSCSDVSLDLGFTEALEKLQFGSSSEENGPSRKEHVSSDSSSDSDFHRKRKISSESEDSSSDQPHAPRRRDSTPPGPRRSKRQRKPNSRYPASVFTSHVIPGIDEEEELIICSRSMYCFSVQAVLELPPHKGPESWKFTDAWHHPTNETQWRESIRDEFIIRFHARKQSLGGN